MGNCCINNKNNNDKFKELDEKDNESKSEYKDDANFDVIIKEYNENTNRNNQDESIPIEIKPVYGFTRKNCIYNL